MSTNEFKNHCSAPLIPMELESLWGHYLHCGALRSCHGLARDLLGSSVLHREMLPAMPVSYR